MTTLSARTFAPLLAVLLTASAAAPQVSAPEQLKALRTRLHDQRAQSDWPASLATAREISRFLNDYPRAVFDLARAELNSGNADAAMRDLEEYARMGQSTGQIESSPDLAAIRTHAGYADLIKRMQANREPVSTAQTAFTIADSGLLPEDIDYDPATKRFLVTSVLKRKIVSVSASGEATDFAKAPDNWPMMALKIDSKRKLVWATEVALQDMSFVPRTDWGRSALLGFDLDTGKLLRRIDGPTGAALADMVLTAAGDVILSDGQTGGIYRLTPKATQLERIDNGDFVSPQTVTMYPGGKKLFVPDYLRGIGLLDLKTRRVEWLSSEGRYALSGIDGLYLSGRKLLAVQNGTSPERVIAFTLDPTLTHIVSETLIDRSTDTLGDPTHGVLVGTDFYYLSNSGWDTLDDSGNLLPDAHPTPPHILRAHLP